MKSGSVKALRTRIYDDLRHRDLSKTRRSEYESFPVHTCDYGI